ncbi:MAG: 5-formyltetrahydrofolate cyclo-ligase [Chloroflexi bacterium]|nr:5-formyltetrahydrofolate cyclo-ligase [Chloroflexota bacterium]
MTWYEISVYQQPPQKDGCCVINRGYNRGMSIPPALEKGQLRSQCRRQRASLGAEFRLQASREICAHITAWPVFQQARVVSTYLAMGAEVDLSLLLEQYPTRQWAVPRVLPEGRMLFHAYDPAHLVRHPFGMAEPAAHLPLVASLEIDLALVPGLAYDICGWRLGYGGGFFDRFLAGFGGTSLGVAFAAMVLSDLPHHGHDVPVQYLATETGVICAASRPAA